MWQAYALCPSQPVNQSKINLHHHNLLVNSCFQLYVHLQDLEVVADQGEEEFEVKMDPAWTFRISSAPLALSLLKEGFQGKKRIRIFCILLVTGSQVSDSSWNFFGYSVIHHGRLCVIGHQKNPPWCSTVQTRILSSPTLSWNFHKD